MSNLTYDDFKQRLSIQDVLVDAGYTLNRRDGLRYPSYVRLGSDGRRIHGDKFIVTANGQCCFQPPTQRNYNVIGFIKAHPEMFSDYTPGMDKDRLVNLVCNRLLNNPIEDREAKIVTERQQMPIFSLDDYTIHKFEGGNKETHKPFYPYFKPRGLNLGTQYAFRKTFFLAERQSEDGRVFKNLSFPMTVPGKDDKIVGLEERGRKKPDGTSYKGIARGSNASEGLWIGCPEATKLQDAKRVFIFESAYDAMAFYQILMGKGSSFDAEAKKELSHAVFASTGGNPSARQLEGLIRNAKDATFHIGFDMDEAGRNFAEQFKTLAEKENVPSNHIVREEPSEGYKDFNEELLAILADEEKNVAVGVDLDADGNVEVSESEETKHHGMRR